MSRVAGPLSALSQRLRTPQRASPGAVVLGYHDVTRPGEETTSYCVTGDALRSHIVQLRDLGLQIVPATELVDRMIHGESVDGLAVITFDDALVGVYRNAVEVLTDLDAPATVFVVTDVLGVRPPWWTGPERTMTTSELSELMGAGIALGSHTRTHRSLPDLDDEPLRTEVVGSLHDLQAWSPGAAPLIAYPSGHHDVRVRSLASDSGYAAGFTFLNGRVEPDTDRFRIPRLNMGGHTTTRRLRYHLLRSAASWPDHQFDTVGAPAGPS